MVKTEKIHKIGNLFKGDVALWFCTVALMVISCVAVYSAIGLSAISVSHSTPLRMTIKHLLFVVLTFGVVTACSNVNYRFYSKISMAAYLLVLVMLVVMLLLGLGRWFEVAGFSLQPSEFSKVVLICFLSRLISKHQQHEEQGGEARKYYFGIMMVAIGVNALLIFPENFSTAALIIIVCLAMLFQAGVERKKVLLIVLAIAVVGVVFLMYAHRSYIKQRDRDPQVAAMMEAEGSGLLPRLTTWGHRVDAWLNPDPDELTQESMARMAVATGRTMGVGVGNTIQARLMTQAHNDFIYAIIIEEMGWIGGLAVFVLYAVMFYRCLVISYRCKGAYGAYVSMGLGLLIFIQAVVNMFVAVGVLPVTGQTLPLVSYGGSAYLATGIAIGIIQSVANDTKKTERKVEAHQRQQREFQAMVDLANSQMVNSK